MTYANMLISIKHNKLSIRYKNSRYQTLISHKVFYQYPKNPLYDRKYTIK